MPLTVPGSAPVRRHAPTSRIPPALQHRHPPPTAQVQLQEDLLELMPGVETANSISEELDKRCKFEILLVSPQMMGKTSGNTEVRAVCNGVMFLGADWQVLAALGFLVCVASWFLPYNPLFPCAYHDVSSGDAARGHRGHVTPPLRIGGPKRPAFYVFFSAKSYKKTTFYHIC